MRNFRQLYLGAAILLLTAAGVSFALTPAPKPAAKTASDLPAAGLAASPRPAQPKLLGADTSPTSTPTPAPAPQPTPPQPIWADEFNGPAGTPADPARWNTDTGGWGWGNDEWEYYLPGTANAAQDGAGHLVITARRPASPPGPCALGPCNITSARLQTQGLFAVQYGRIETRLKTPAGNGLWPAFWMLPADDSDTGEIDIMENNGRDPGIISGTLHGPGFTGAGGIARELQFLPGTGAASSFHVYAVDWSPQAITWSVDGTAYQTVRQSSLGSRWIYNRPYYLLLNLAVGGDDPGYPDATTSFPASLIVDYVRIYK